MNLNTNFPTAKRKNPFLKNMGMISTETINAQDDNFPGKLEALISEIKTKSDEVIDQNLVKKLPLYEINELVNSVIKKNYIDTKISKLIFDRFGLKVEMHCDEITHGAILTFPVTDNNVLLKDYFKGHDFFKKQIQIQKLKNEDVGTIDLVNAKVGGIFSQYKHPFYISFGLNLFVEKLTPGEVTAIILHELGHAFTYYEYSDRILAVNQVLYGVAEELEKDTSKRDYTYIYNQLKNKLEVDSKDIDKILESKDPNIISGILFTAISNKILKESKVGKYEETASEQLADQFAARFGYGRQLVLGLDKLMQKYSPERNGYARFMTLFYQILAVFALITTIMTILTTSLVNGVLLIFIKFSLLISITLSIALSGDYTRDMTYDDLLFRYRRIRLDIIQQLKNKYYTDENSEKLIEDIKDIDATIVKVKPFSGLYRPMMNILIPINYKAKKEIQYQQMVEFLASSDLFVKAAELKSLA
jgi:hypothetical protein